jgi:hypothetical protein
MKIKNIKIESYDRIFQKEIKFIEPRNIDEMINAIETFKKKKLRICFRGNAKSYGDQNFIEGKDINISIKKLNRIIKFDEANLEIEVETGVTISRLLLFLNNKGYTIKCIPGIKDITIGGSIANNVHGKDSYKDGFFSDHVKQLIYYDINKKKFKKLTPNDNEFNYFRGAGGMLGFIYSLKLKVYPYYHAVKVNKVFFSNLNELAKKLYLLKDYSYSYIYINNFEKKDKLGCGYIELGENIKKNIRHMVLIEKLKILITKKILQIVWLIGRTRIREIMFVANKIFLYFQTLRPKTSIVRFEEYNFPHQKIPSFYCYLYPKGFYEIQFFIRENQLINILKKILIYLQENSIESYFTGVKLHNKNKSIINYFNQNSYSVGFDIDKTKFKKKNFQIISSILKEFDCLVYFAKDSIFTMNDFGKNQKKQINNLLKIKQKYDPENLYYSNLMKRINYEKN